MSDEVVLDMHDGIARLKLNRPKMLNALDGNLGNLLIKHSSALRSNGEVRCIILEGTGDNFCAGGDITMFKSMLDLHPAERQHHYQLFLSQLHLAILNFMRTPAPLIARVQGAAAGFGLSLVLAADLAVAADNAKFTLAYSQIGLSPDGSSTYFLPRIVGLKKAKELAFFGDRFDAAEALRLGILNQVVPLSDLDSVVDELAQRVSRGATQALGRTKFLLDQSLHNDAVTQLEAETEAFAAGTASDDFLEGVNSFLEKRAPSFRGS